MRMQTIFIDGPLNEDWSKRTQDITDYPLFPEPLTSSVSVGFFGGEFVAACEAHGEFTCKSKACAPPPVGTGGSLPSASGTEGSGGRGGHTPKVIAVRSWDEIEEKFGVDGTGERHVYRSVSEADYQRMKRQGFLDTDGRGNISADEGLVTAKHLPWVYLGDIARKGADDNPTGTGRILKIRREASDGWREDRDGYIKTSDKVPFDRVEMVTMPIGVRREIKYYGEPGDEGNSTTRTFYDWSAADRPLTASACEAHGEFECKSRACAPPPVGTGGSLPTAAQHVTSREAAASIKSGGFIVGKGEMHGSMFGNAVYLSKAGDKQAAGLYRKATKEEQKEPALVKATVRLKNPLKVSGKTTEQVTDDMVKKMGGLKAVQKAAASALQHKADAMRKALKDVLGDDAVDRVSWDDDFILDPVVDEMSRDQYKTFMSKMTDALGDKGWVSDLTVKTLKYVIDGNTRRASKTVGTLARELGYDGIEITNEPFTDEVGGSQIVVFDPKSITVESVEDFGALIERLGIEVTYEFNESALTACAVHGEFACNSRACAPPPVGTGGSISTGVGDLARAALSGGMSGIYTARGFDAKPRVVSDAQFSHLVRQGKVRESWRGISLAGGEKSVPDEVARAFERADKHPVVEGSFGSGTYVAFGKFGEREARQYAGKGGSVLRIGIPPKMGSEPALRQITEVVDRMTRGGEGVKAFERQNIAAGVRLYKSLRDAGITDSEVKRLASDAGVIGMLLGWDGVYVSNGEGGVGYAVVWNRGATVVDSEVLTASVSVGFVDGGLVFACETHGEFACKSRACAPPPTGTGGSLPSGASADRKRLPNGADPEIHAEKMMGGKTFHKEFAAGVREKWDQFMPKKPVVRMRVPLDALRDISIDNGVILSQHDTGSSNGYYDPTMREDFETAMFGKKGTKPKYGYIADADTGKVLTPSGLMNHYGNIVLEFKPSVTKRTTVSMSDSLVGSPDDVVAPIRVSDVPTASAERLHVATAPTHGNDPWYMEAQIHGKLTLKDVSRVYFEKYEDDYFEDDVANVRYWFKELGIDVDVVVVEQGDFSGFSVCDEHGEFACKSRSCAPPPVGTGGSLPSGSAERWTGGEATVPIAPKTAAVLTLDHIKSTWPRKPEEVMKILGDREPYPDGFKVSDAQAAAIERIGSSWISIGSNAVSMFRRYAAEAIETGIDAVAKGDISYPDNGHWRHMVARTLTALRSAPVSTVWRGLRVSEEMLNGWEVGGIYSETFATATGRRTLALNFASGRFGNVGGKRSGNVKVLLKMKARNISIGGSVEGNLVDLADERFISGKFRIVSVERDTLVNRTKVNVIEVEQIDD